MLELQKKLPPSCQIIAVSKLQSVEKILNLYGQGQRHFAENYVQEALKKQSEISKPDICWHFIGRLQKNKAKDVVGKFNMIHSVDQFTLAEAINKQAEKKNLIQKILIQVNLSKEETKGGVDEQGLDQLLEKTQQLKNIQVLGLMTMPPLEEDPEKSRPYFKKLKLLQLKLVKKYPQLKELSMGTSSDYIVAAEEGATFVRLGTILFGERMK